MAAHSDLEIGIYGQNTSNPQDTSPNLVVARFTKAGSTELRIESGPAKFDIAGLQELRSDLAQYGAQLSRCLFAHEPIRLLFHDAFVESRNGTPLHLRLFIDRTGSDLHLLLWETLRNPEDDFNSLLAADPSIFFSRYLRSSDWGSFRLHPRDQMRALVVVANPSDLGEFEIFLDSERKVRRKLAKIDVEGEVERAKTAFADIEQRVQWLVQPGQSTLDRIMTTLETTDPIGVDILYLVCHGEVMTFPVPGPYLWLENEQGMAAAVRAKDLVDRVALLPPEKRPRLVVLASCQSAGTGNLGAAIPAGGETSREDGSALVPLGPMLAGAGIPAVIAMQGKVTMETIKGLMPHFFSDLCKDGCVDQALSFARRQLHDRPDIYMPVLFMRIANGSLWHAAVTGPGGNGFASWTPLVNSIQNAQSLNASGAVCLPILGPGLVEDMIGSRNDAALELARLHSYPFRDQDRENLPQVAQFMTNSNDLNFTYDEFRKFLKKQLQAVDRKRFPDGPALVPGNLTLADPDRMFTRLGKKIRDEEQQGGKVKDLHSILAGFHLPLYLTANYDTLLQDALSEQQVKIIDEDLGTESTVTVVPHPAAVCNWRSLAQGGKPQAEMTALPDWSPATPLVYYLFGRLNDRDSLVLTQDNYYDFLINVNQEPWRIPQKIRTALVESVLLFLGFPTDDWGLRLILRLLANHPAFARLQNHANIAVQIDPGNAQFQDPDQARKYYEDYFKRGHVEIYWGRTEDFIFELDQRVHR